MFDDANIKIISDDGEAERGDNRIKIGILVQLAKFIKIVKQLSNLTSKVVQKEVTEGETKVEKKETISNFNIEIEYDVLVNQKDKSTNFVATSTYFKSDKLKMRLDGFRISEFSYLSDEVFKNQVFYAEDAVTLEITAAAINDIIKISDIVKFDARKDALIFYTKDKTLFVEDRGNGTEGKPNFVYNIGELDAEPQCSVSIPLTRERFIRMLGNASEDFKIIIGKSSNGSVDRLLFDSVTSTTKIAIAAMQNF